MKSFPTALSLLVVALCGIGDSAFAGDSNSDDNQYNRILERGKLRSEFGTEAAVREILFPPGWTAPTHYHNSDLHIFVIEGSFEVAMKDSERKLYSAGQALRMQPGQIMDARNTSDTEPLKLIVFQVGDPDAEFAVPVE